MVFLKVLLISLSVCLLLSLPEILYIRKVKASSLFSEDQLDISKTINFRLLPAVCLLFSLSIWMSNSFKIGSVFFLSLIVGSIFIVSFSFSFIKLIEPSAKLNYRLKQAFRYILHHKAESALYILCIGVSACLLNLIPQIQNSLNKELDLKSHKERPSLFIFDIQEYQLDELKNLLEKENYKLENTSPLIRGRIVSVNGKEFTRDDKKYFSREDQGAQAIKNRTLNLSYRKNLSSSEEIIDGEFPQDSYDFDADKEIEISLEFRYARRLGVGIGDKIKIEIQD